MKILQINTVCGIRSTGRICTDIAELLEREGHTCKIAYGRGNVPEPYRKYAVRIGSGAHVYLHALRTRLFDSTGFGSRRATQHLVRWIEEYDPDVIHLHNLHGYYIHIGVLFEYLKQAGKPVIWTLHDCWPFTGHCAHFEQADCHQWRLGGCLKCPQKSAYPKSLLKSRSALNFAEKKALFTAVKDLTPVTPSRWLSEYVKLSFLGQTSPEIIPNGVDLTVFRPMSGDFRQRHGLEGKTMLLGVASAWSADKGLYDFYRLAKELGEPYRIVLVGLDDKQLRELPQGILGVARTANVRELAEIYSAADLFLNPTYADTYPTVNLEAQACGTPIITYDTGGSPESVDPHSGVVVPKGDLAALTDAVKAFVPRPVQNRAALDKERHYRTYLELYGRVSRA